MSRLLHVIPIVHAEADLGRLADTLRALSGDDAWAAKQRAVLEMWRHIAAWCEQVDPHRLYIFQDGLPDDPVAAKIVEDLALQGSVNHRTVRRLLERGGVLVGTERPDLLLREYEYARSAARAMEQEGVASESDAHHSVTLLERRDRAIASKIDATLADGDRGVLFIGMLHDVTSKLPDDIDVDFPLGRGSTLGQDGITRAETQR